MLSKDDHYRTCLQLLDLAESTSWNRFYNFLMCNSILVLAWATLYAQDQPPWPTRVVLALIATLGGVSGVLWAALGKCGREITTAHVNQAHKLEPECLDPSTPDELRPIGEAKRIRLNHPKWASSTCLLQAGPWGFTVLCAVLFVASLL